MSIAVRAPEIIKSKVIKVSRRRRNAQSSSSQPILYLIESEMEDGTKWRVQRELWEFRRLHSDISLLGFILPSFPKKRRKLESNERKEILDFWLEGLIIFWKQRFSFEDYKVHGSISVLIREFLTINPIQGRYGSMVAAAPSSTTKRWMNKKIRKYASSFDEHSHWNSGTATSNNSRRPRFSSSLGIPKSSYNTTTSSSGGTSSSTTTTVANHILNSAGRNDFKRASIDSGSAYAESASEFEEDYFEFDETGTTKSDISGGGGGGGGNKYQRSASLRISSTTSPSLNIESNIVHHPRSANSSRRNSEHGLFPNLSNHQGGRVKRAQSDYQDPRIPSQGFALDTATSSMIHSSTTSSTQNDQDSHYLSRTMSGVGSVNGTFFIKASNVNYTPVKFRRTISFRSDRAGSLVVPHHTNSATENDTSPASSSSKAVVIGDSNSPSLANVSAVMEDEYSNYIPHCKSVTLLRRVPAMSHIYVDDVDNDEDGDIDTDEEDALDVDVQNDEEDDDDESFNESVVEDMDFEKHEVSTLQQQESVEKDQQVVEEDDDDEIVFKTETATKNNFNKSLKRVIASQTGPPLKQAIANVTRSAQQQQNISALSPTLDTINISDETSEVSEVVWECRSVNDLVDQTDQQPQVKKPITSPEMNHQNTSNTTNNNNSSSSSQFLPRVLSRFRSGFRVLDYQPILPRSNSLTRYKKSEGFCPPVSGGDDPFMLFVATVQVPQTPIARQASDASLRRDSNASSGSSSHPRSSSGGAEECYSPISVPPTPNGKTAFDESWQAYTTSLLRRVRDRLNSDYIQSSVSYMQIETKQNPVANHRSEYQGNSPIQDLADDMIYASTNNNNNSLSSPEITVEGVEEDDDDIVAITTTAPTFTTSTVSSSNDTTTTTSTTRPGLTRAKQLFV